MKCRPLHPVGRRGTVHPLFPVVATVTAFAPPYAGCWAALGLTGTPSSHRALIRTAGPLDLCASSGSVWHRRATRRPQYACHRWPRRPLGTRASPIEQVARAAEPVRTRATKRRCTPSPGWARRARHGHAVGSLAALPHAPAQRRVAVPEAPGRASALSRPQPVAEAVPSCAKTEPASSPSLSPTERMEPVECGRRHPVARRGNDITSSHWLRLAPQDTAANSSLVYWAALLKRCSQTSGGFSSNLYVQIVYLNAGIVQSLLVCIPIRELI